MIHYTLLPEENIKTLKRDYRIRIFITLMIFIASGITIGILSLLPSYIVSYTLEKNLINKVQNIQKDRAADGIDNVISELKKSYTFVGALRTDKSKISFTSNIETILALKPKNVSLTSFEIASSSKVDGISDIVVQGIASTRESLLSFKKSIESNPVISKVELPISDLTKNKDLPFAMRFVITKPDEK
jgi:hypothetical protein